MEPRISLITPGVSDLGRSVTFYREGLGLPQREGPDGIAFFETRGTWLLLYPRASLAEDVTVSSEGSGFRGFTLAHDVSSPEDVDRVLQQAVDAGASLVKPGQEVFWGVLTQHGSCDEGVRSFCGSCGSQLTYEKRSTPQQLDIALATLDDASGLHPECHIWTSHKLPWVSLGEELPVYDEWSHVGP